MSKLHTAQEFSEIGNRKARALQAYLVLVSAASNRKILTYGLLATMLGFEKGAGVLSQTLGHIMYWCKQKSLPPLTCIVVNQETGKPGDGLIAAEDANLEREKVYQFDWFSIVPPTMDALAAAYAEGHSALAD